MSFHKNQFHNAYLKTYYKTYSQPKEEESFFKLSP